MTTILLDHLREQGYEPQHGQTPDGRLVDQYDLTVSGTGTVRVCIYPNDGHSAAVHHFDAFMANEWSARFTPGTPGAVVVAAVEAAEWQLAVKRGGPVTPAQERNAR